MPLRDHFADTTLFQYNETDEGKPLAIPAEAADPKPEYLVWHREKVFGRS